MLCLVCDGLCGIFQCLRVSAPCCREKVKTHVEITPEDESGSFSIVHVKTRDRPGLLTEIVRTLKDLNVNVISAEVCASCLAVSVHAPEIPSLTDHEISVGPSSF